MTDSDIITRKKSKEDFTDAKRKLFHALQNDNPTKSAKEYADELGLASTLTVFSLRRQLIDEHKMYLNEPTSGAGRAAKSAGGETVTLKGDKSFTVSANLAKSLGIDKLPDHAKFDISVKLRNEDKEGDEALVGSKITLTYTGRQGKGRKPRNSSAE